MPIAKLQIFNDGGDIESPNYWGGWRLYSFNRNHNSFTHPDTFFDPMTIGLRRKLDVGTAFLLSYSEHGLCRWNLQYEGSSCQWDSVSCAGILIWEGKLSDLPKDRETRKESARAFCVDYTTWANGDVWGFSLTEEPDGEDIDSCGGFYGSDALFGTIRESLAEYQKEKKISIMERYTPYLQNPNPDVLYLDVKCEYDLYSYADLMG